MLAQMTTFPPLPSTIASARITLSASTVVVFDYRANQPAPVSDEMRAAISQLEGETF